MNAAELTTFIKSRAKHYGFDACGIAQADRLARAEEVANWLAAGYAGSMGYMHRYFEQRVDPRVLFPGAQSVIVVALNYHQRVAPADRRVQEPASPRYSGAASCHEAYGRVAMYAWGEDYHRVLKSKLHSMVRDLEASLGAPAPDAPRPIFKICVDTAPIVEREWAAAAGVGWIGKNTLVLRPGLGSYFFLGVIVTTLPLAPDEPIVDHCGTCTACLEVCPTRAFPAPYRMDASRCISFLTIEHRGEIPMELQPGMGNWIFGCDLCQEVCPHNHKAPETTEPQFAVRTPAPTIALQEMSRWTDEQYREQLAGSAMQRATADMLRRNVRIAARNATQTVDEHNARNSTQVPRNGCRTGR